MRFGSLFSGIGGFDLAFERTGMECAWQVEIDKWCNQVLRRHWPDVSRYENVEEFHPNETEDVDLICGGFPCQDLSVAGRREGLSGKRSGLWWQFHRVLQEARPSWVVIENVTGLLSSNDGRDMGTVLGALGQCGYRWAYRVLDSQFFGVAQRRRRVFIVGYLGDGRTAEVLFEREGCQWDTPTRKETGEGTTRDARNCAVQHSGEALRFSNVSDGSAARNADDKVPPLTNRHGDPGMVCFEPGNLRRRCGAEPNSEVCSTLGAHKTGDTFPHVAMGVSENQRAELRLTPYSRQITSGGGKPGQGYPAVLWEMSHADEVVRERNDQIAPTLNKRMGTGGNQVPLVGVRRLTPLECERLQAFPDGWTACGIDEDGQAVKISDTQRYKQLGNAVTVNVVQWIGRRIMETK